MSSVSHVRPPLHSAVIEENLELCETLLKNGANVNQLYHSSTPLTYYLMNINTNLEKDCLSIPILLLKYGADVNIGDVVGFTPLIRACQRNNVELCKLLIDHGSKMDVQDHYGWTPLHHAARYNSPDVCLFLIENNANIHAKTEGGLTPFKLARDCNIKNILESGNHTKFCKR